jgi:hypothetical protein
MRIAVKEGKAAGNTLPPVLRLLQPESHADFLPHSTKEQAHPATEQTTSTLENCSERRLSTRE